MVAEIQYKTMFYRYCETPTLVLLGISAVAISAPPLVSLALLVFGVVLVTVDLIVYVIRFRSLPPNESLNLPSERRLTLHRVAVIFSMLIVMIRAGAVLYM